MSFNVMDLVTDQLQGPLLDQMTNLLGDDGGNASSGLQAAVPALLSGLTGAAQVPGGADKLFNAVQDQDDGLLGNLGSMLGGSDSSSIVSSGTNILGSLLGGGALGSLGSVLGKFTGMSSGGTSSLLGMLAPILLGVLKKQVLGGGLDSGGLSSMLLGQKNNIMSAMPSGLGDQLSGLSGFPDISSAIGDVAGGLQDAAGGVAGGLRDAAGDVAGGLKDTAGDVAGGLKDAAGAGLSSATAGVAGAASGVADAASGVGNAAQDAIGSAQASGGGLKKILIPLIAIALLGWLAFKFLGNNDVDAIKDQAASVAGDIDVSALGGDLTGVFDSASQTLGGITDLDSAKAAVPGLEEIGGKVSGLTDMFNKVPEAARGPLSGIASEGLGSLQPIIDKVMAIPGVGDVLKPIIEPILSALQGMAG